MRCVATNIDKVILWSKDNGQMKSLVVHIFSRVVWNKGKVLKLGESETQLFSDLNKSKEILKM